MINKYGGHSKASCHTCMWCGLWSTWAAKSWFQSLPRIYQAYHSLSWFIRQLSLFFLILVSYFPLNWAQSFVLTHCFLFSFRSYFQKLFMSLHAMFAFTQRGGFDQIDKDDSNLPLDTAPIKHVTQVCCHIIEKCYHGSNYLL